MTGAESDAAHPSSRDLSAMQTRVLPAGSEDLPLPPRRFAPAPTPATEPAPLVVPPRIRHFTILQQVGQGGMGLVYSAYDNELDRKVAIKLLRASQGDSLGAVRLHREAEAMARLTHPNIVRVYEVGELEGTHHLVYLVMEFVQGDPLRRWSRQAKRPWRDVLAMMLQAGKGLAAAHAAGLVHRDFKPKQSRLPPKAPTSAKRRGSPTIGAFEGEAVCPGVVRSGQDGPKLAQSEGSILLRQVGGVTGPGGHRAAREPGRRCGRPAGRPGWPARWPPGARPSAAGVAISAT